MSDVAPIEKSRGSSLRFVLHVADAEREAECYGNRFSCWESARTPFQVELTARDAPVMLVLVTDPETTGYVGHFEVSLMSSDCYERLRSLCNDDSHVECEVHGDHLWFADPDETPWLFLDATRTSENVMINEGATP